MTDWAGGVGVQRALPGIVPKPEPRTAQCSASAVAAANTTGQGGKTHVRTLRYGRVLSNAVYHGTCSGIPVEYVRVYGHYTFGFAPSPLMIWHLDDREKLDGGVFFCSDRDTGDVDCAHAVYVCHMAMAGARAPWPCFRMHA